MLCPTCDANLVCASCRNPLADSIPDAISSEEPLLNVDGAPLFGDDDDDDEDDEDDDSVSLAVGFDDETGLVILNFGKPTAWLALSPENAEDMAKLILENAKASRESQMS